MRTHGTVQKGSDIPDTKSDIPDIKSDTDRTTHRTLPDTQTGHAPDIHRTSPDITGHTGHPVTQGSAAAGHLVEWGKTRKADEFAVAEKSGMSEIPLLHRSSKAVSQF